MIDREGSNGRGGETGEAGHFFLFFKFLLPKHFFLFVYFLAVLGLHCCARAFSSCGEQELLFIAVHGLLMAVASLVMEHRL